MDKKEIFQLLTFLITIISVVVAMNANHIAETAEEHAAQANEIALEANEIAFQANDYIEMIEKSNLRLGDFKYTNKSISVSLINSYSARYPAYVTGVFMNGKALQISNISADNSLLIERGEPAEIKINLEDYLIDKNDGTQIMVVEFRYMDLPEMEFKSMNLTYSIDISNNNITEFRPLDIREKTILSIQTNY